MRCRICGEPWDMDSLHEEISAEIGSDAVRAMSQEMYEKDFFNPMKNRFYKEGCVALGSSCNGASASPLIGQVYELLGDDIDGAEAELEDLEWLGEI